MKKFFIAAFLLGVIILTFSIVILTVLGQGSEDNFFNKNYRKNIAMIPWLRSILSLHDSGDAASDYLGKRYSKIVIEVDAMAGNEIPTSALDLLTRNISNVTGKKVRYVISDRNIPATDVSSFSEISEISEKYRDFSNTKDEVVIYFLYLNRFEEDDTQVGTTFKEFGLVLFDKTLEEFSRSYPENFSNYLESTALHEFGHQLGLPHNNNQACLMQAVVEDYDLWANRDGVVTDFCEYEKQLLK